MIRVLLIFYLFFISLVSADQVVLEGDSLTDNATRPDSIWTVKLEEIDKKIANSQCFNVAVSGKKVETMLQEYSDLIHPHAPQKKEKGYLFVWGGVNDLIWNRTPQQVYADLKLIWAQAQSDGFKVVAFTLMPLYKNEVQSKELNDLILSDRTLFNYIVRTDLIFPDYNDQAYFNSDHIHLNRSAEVILANYIYRQLQKRG